MNLLGVNRNARKKRLNAFKKAAEHLSDKGGDPNLIRKQINEVYPTLSKQ